MGFLSDLLDKLLGNRETVIAARKADSSPTRSSVIESTEKAGEPISYKDAVSYEHIKREFGDGFLFSPEAMQVSEREVDLFTSGSRHRRNITGLILQSLKAQNTKQSYVSALVSLLLIRVTESTIRGMIYFCCKSITESSEQFIARADTGLLM